MQIMGNKKKQKILEIQERKKVFRRYMGESAYWCNVKEKVWRKKIKFLKIRTKVLCLVKSYVQRLRWVGHVMKLNDLKLPKILLKNGIVCKRGKGRPKNKKICKH